MDEVSEDYFSLTQQASDSLSLETAAIIKLQSFYRGSRIREKYHAVMNGARLIQRISRGTLARVRTRLKRKDRQRQLNMHFFHHCACVIQRYFRGWRSRKHLHHFHGRKRYLQKIEMRGEHTRDWLHQYHRVKLAQAKHDEEAKMRQEFHDMAGELHHLVSTKAVAGVYNPPYNDSLPRAFEKPIEQHLRDSSKVQVPKSLRRPRHPQPAPSQALGASHREMQEAAYAANAGPPQDLPRRASHRSRSASVGRMQKIQGPFRSREQQEVSNAKAVQLHRTIRASAPYDLLEADDKMQRHLDKLTRVSPIDFMAPGLPAQKAPPSSVHTGIPQRERPMELRGDYTELPKIRDKPPFFTAMPHDRHFAEYHEQMLIPHGHI